MKLCSKSEYLIFGVVASLNHSSAGDSDFSHKPTVVIFCLSDGLTPKPIRLQLMVFKNSLGCIESSCVPENSVRLICWLIIGHRDGVGGGTLGGVGNGLHCGECLDDNVGSSEVSSMSDNVIDDSDVVDAVGDDVAAVLGMIVSVRGRVAKCPLK